MSKWINIDKKKPDLLDVRIKLHDGSQLNVWFQNDGDFWSEQLKIFIHESHVSHWKPNYIEKS